MNFHSTRTSEIKISFREAVQQGLAPDKGLFIPERIPKLEKSFFERLETMSELEIAFEVLSPYTEGTLDPQQLKDILKKTLSFPLPAVKVSEGIYSLELFHGPTQAFKDVGARFMANCLAAFRKKKKKVTVLVATSGDTGSAVASGFFGVDGVEVKILFPKGKVSAYQEHQMTSLGRNIQAIEVDGSFDDCQTLVKQAFLDEKLRDRLSLSSANSINIARFLPQMLYYFFSYKQLRPLLHSKKWLVSVPSGNFGNLTAGLYAKHMGLPIDRMVAANNANDPFYLYWKTGKYKPKASVPTYSNAMDVGAPSNFERIQSLYQDDWRKLKQDIAASRFSDQQTVETIKKVYHEHHYTLDPHGAVGYLALREYMDNESIGTFLETAHPNKFESVVRIALPKFKAPETDLSLCQKISMSRTYGDFRNWLLQTNITKHEA